jgi:ADP-ribose pyrophosphatase YjhB (NUDIX family)
MHSAEPELQHQSFDVGVKALLVNKNRILLVKRADLQKWEVPGGRINIGENMAHALRREIREELPGTTYIRVQGLVYADQANFLLPNGNALMLLFFLITAKTVHPLKLSNEHTDQYWASFEELPRLLTSRPIIVASRRALRGPLSARDTPLA